MPLNKETKPYAYAYGGGSMSILMCESSGNVHVDMYLDVDI